MNTVNTDIINYLQKIGCGTFGKNLFYGRVPDSNKTETVLWWVIPNNVSPTAHNVTGEDTLNYNYELSYRNTSLKEVDDEIFRLTKEIVGSHCYELDNYTTIDIQLVSASPRLALDVEGRIVGTIVFSAKVYNILSPNYES